MVGGVLLKILFSHHNDIIINYYCHRQMHSSKAHLHFQPSHAVASGIVIATGCCISQWGIANYNSWKGVEQNAEQQSKNTVQ